MQLWICRYITIKLLINFDHFIINKAFYTVYTLVKLPLFSRISPFFNNVKSSNSHMLHFQTSWLNFPRWLLSGILDDILLHRKLHPTNINIIRSYFLIFLYTNSLFKQMRYLGYILLFKYSLYMIVRYKPFLFMILCHILYL